MGKKSQEDQLNRTYAATIEGIGFDSIVELARLQGAKIFETSADQIYVKAGNLRVATVTPFRRDLGVQAFPQTWKLDVVVGVKDREQD